MKKRLILSMMAFVLVFSAFAIFRTVRPANAATTIVVNSISDAAANDGVCTFREAIIASNTDTASGVAVGECAAGSGNDTINFAISGTGVHTLTPASAYDVIIEPVTINGYSQSGSSPNTAVAPAPFNGTLTIEIDGTSAGTSNGLMVNPGGEGTTIRGLVINSFEINGISAQTDDVTVVGNYIGTDPTGMIDEGNTEFGAAGNWSNFIVGGTAAADRNVLSGNTRSGVAFQDGSGCIARGNYIGVSADGATVISNGGGQFSNVSITAADNSIIGGTETGSTNVISGTGSGANGIVIIGSTAFGGTAATGTVIQGNYIGTNPDGEVEAGFGNANFAIGLIADTQNTLVGGTTAGAGNIIAGNGGGVVGFSVAANTMSNNSILGNSIHSNTGGTITSLGIDLLDNSAGDFTTFTGVGVNPNDSGDPDTASNVYMNYPVISGVASANGTATVTYSLDINDTEPGATGYRVEFFANDAPDASGNGQGQTYLGFDTVSGDVTNRSATITLPSGVSGAKYITAITTMTDASGDGYGHSSEFSANTLATLVAATSTPASASLADTGSNAYAAWALGIILLTAGTLGLREVSRRTHYTSGK